MNACVWICFTSIIGPCGSTWLFLRKHFGKSFARKALISPLVINEKERSMRILVTGGAGFIASHVADAYIEAGHEVAILDDLSRGHRRNIHSKAKFFQGDI